MKTCNTCGGYVSADFVRVFGTEDGRVYACPNCVPNAALYAGVAARADW